MDEEATGKAADRKASFKCRKCRLPLFESDIVTSAHGGELQIDDRGQSSPDSSCASDDGTVWYLKEDRLPAWLRKSVEESSWIKGKILCPKCGHRLGSFDFVNGSQCSCRETVLPAVHVKKGKLDCHFDKLPAAIQEFGKQPPSSLVMMNHPGSCLPPNKEVVSSTSVLLAASCSNSVNQNCDGTALLSAVEITQKSATKVPSERSKNQGRKLGECCTDGEVLKTNNCSEKDKPTEDLICPVCLEVYYEATACLPCGHIFCEPCLRNLGKKKPTATACPLCRQLIQQCLPQAGLRKIVAEKYPNLYKDRKSFEQKLPTSDFPLPWQPGYRFRRHPDVSTQDQNYLQNLLFSVPSDNSSETFTFSASSLIVVISLMTVFIVTLLAGYLCIRYFMVEFFSTSFEETQYMVFTMFYLFVAFIIRWYFRYQVRSSLNEH